MHTLTPASGVVLALVLAASGCAPGPPAPAPDFDAADADSSGTVWGDEHPGLLVDPDEWEARSGSLTAEVVEGSTRSARVAAGGHGLGARVRSSSAGTFGALEWRGDGWLRHAAAGTVSATVAEGALVGDPRENADPRANSTWQQRGLAISTTSASWASRVGAGFVLAPGRLRAAAGAWQADDDASTRVVFASVEHRTQFRVAGVAGGGTTSSRARERAVSCFGACTGESSFLAGEVAVAADRVRSVARAVIGSRREWSAIAVAGAAPPDQGSVLFGTGGRWGAALERRDRWGWGASRMSASTLTRTTAGREARRRRVSWDGSWRVSGDARVEIAARVTREADTRGATGVLGGPPVAGIQDDWRVRATLRARREPSPGWIVDNSYRMEWLENRSDRPGTVATWTFAVHGAGLECRLSASAFALRGAQVAYARDPGPFDAGAFTAVSGKGAALSALARLRLSSAVTAGASWTRRPPGEARVLVFLTFRA